MIGKLLIVALVATLTTSIALAAPRATADVDSARFAEYTSIFEGGVVAGYSVNDRQVRMEGDHGMAQGDMAMAKDDHMQEGARCWHGDHGARGGHGCCDDCCWEPEGCYDCWGVWHPETYWDYEATRESDQDLVMGRGDTGRGWFW